MKIEFGVLCLLYTRDNLYDSRTFVQISEISPGAFAGLTALNHLSLFGNRLQKPLDSWFRTIIQNNGNLELDYRINSTIGREPNNWLCCPDVSLYYFFVGEQDKSLFSYPQLDVICTWPVPVSGRPISTLTMEELTMTPCSKYTATTTFANSPDESKIFAVKFLHSEFI